MIILLLKMTRPIWKHTKSDDDDDDDDSNLFEHRAYLKKKIREKILIIIHNTKYTIEPRIWMFL